MSSGWALALGIVFVVASLLWWLLGSRESVSSANWMSRSNDGPTSQLAHPYLPWIPLLIGLTLLAVWFAGGTNPPPDTFKPQMRVFEAENNIRLENVSRVSGTFDYIENGKLCTGGTIAEEGDRYRFIRQDPPSCK